MENCNFNLQDLEKEYKINIKRESLITLRGKILPVGGIKEKVLAAINNNIKTIYIPIDNKEDLKDIPAEDLQKEFIGKMAEIIHNDNKED